MEAEFQIRIPEKDLVSVEIVQDVVDYIKSRLKRQG